MTPEKADFYVKLFVESGALKLEPIVADEPKGSQSRHDVDNAEKVAIERNLYQIHAVRKHLMTLNDNGMPEGGAAQF